MKQCRDDWRQFMIDDPFAQRLLRLSAIAPTPADLLFWRSIYLAWGLAIP
jgi:hypothetical protein